MRRTSLLAFALALSVITVRAQLPNVNWYFGHYAAVGFGGGTPVPITGSPMGTNEGTAAISNSLGQLLFYTDGMRVWNALDEQMPGPLLGGSSISTQSALIVPQPNSSLYYIFTTDTWEFTPNDFRYTIVDMSLNNGLGGLTSTVNVLLDNNVREQVAATQNDNGEDYWIVSHQANNSYFTAYSLTANGLDTVPVISETGMIYQGGNCWGGLRFSSDCKRLVSCLGSGSATDRTVELYDFDNVNGYVTNPRLVASWANVPGAYSAEFAPNNGGLYVTGYNTSYVMQYSLGAFDIESTGVNVATTSGTKCGLLRAPDGKIYVGNVGSQFLDAIPDPDITGLGCGYEDNVVDLGPNAWCGLALPNQLSICWQQPTSVTSTDEVQEMEVYPAPFEQGFNVQGLNKSHVWLRLHDALGRVVFEEHVRQLSSSGSWIDPGLLADGWYALEIVAGEERWSRALIKQAR